jgi:hypothetical protein
VCALIANGVKRKRGKKPEPELENSWDELPEQRPEDEDTTLVITVITATGRTYMSQATVTTDTRWGPAVRALIAPYRSLGERFAVEYNGKTYGVLEDVDWYYSRVGKNVPRITLRSYWSVPVGDLSDQDLMELYDVSQTWEHKDRRRRRNIRDEAKRRYPLRLCLLMSFSMPRCGRTTSLKTWKQIAADWRKMSHDPKFEVRGRIEVDGNTITTDAATWVAQHLSERVMGAKEITLEIEYVF